MKKVLFILFFVSAHCFSAGYGGANATNNLGDIFFFDLTDKGFVLYWKKNHDDAWKGSYELSKLCPEFPSTIDPNTSEFNPYISCPKSPNFPLSGVTYERTIEPTYKPCNVKPIFDETPGIIYKCIKGCDNPRAPNIIYESPWECEY